MSDDLSYEVQTVQVDALSTTSTPYKLSFEGQDTAFIAVSSVAMMTPRAQPGLLGAVAVASAAALDVTWTPPHDIEWSVEELQDELQVVTPSASDGVAEIQSVTTEADTDGLSGYFTLELRGETTEIISVDALAEGEGSVKTVLERLSSSGEIEVSRDYSSCIVHGVSVAAGTGKGFVEVSEGCSGSCRLDQNDLVFVAGEQFRVHQIDYGAGRLLGSLGDFTTSEYFAGATVGGALATSGPRRSRASAASSRSSSPRRRTSARARCPSSRSSASASARRRSRAPSRSASKGDATPPLSHDAAAADVKAALEQLSTITDVAITRAVNNNGYNNEVFFGRSRGDVSTIYALDDLLADADTAARVATSTNGKDPENFGTDSLDDMFAGPDAAARVATFADGGATAPRAARRPTRPWASRPASAPTSRSCPTTPRARASPRAPARTSTATAPRPSASSRPSPRPAGPRTSSCTRSSRRRSASSGARRRTRAARASCATSSSGSRARTWATSRRRRR